ncbi:MAG: SAM-dependent methyltransferase [Merdibacter sp.]
MIEVAAKSTNLSLVPAKDVDVLDAFGIDLRDRCVLDVGASTGGFTDVCLKRGARKVYALDVGHDQLHPSLKSDPRCVSMEGRNVRDVRKEWFADPIDFICMDVSFLSCVTALRALHAQFANVETLVLVKPQFEAGSACLNKHGIVKDANVLVRVLESVTGSGFDGLLCAPSTSSSIRGRDGNQEFMHSPMNSERSPMICARSSVTGRQT